MNHAIRANCARIARAHPEVACWRPSAGPTGASGRSDSGQTAAAPPEGVWCSCEALAWRHKIRWKKSLNSQNPPTLSQPRWEPSERPFPALSPAAHRHGSYVSVCEGSERQQGGRLTYTLHSSRFCAESVLMAVDRAAALPRACLSRPWRRVDPSLRALDLPQRSQPPPPESSHPAICATRWSARSRVRRAVGQRYPREVLLV